MSVFPGILSAVAASGGGGGGGGIGDLSTLTPVFGWGTVKRNSAYTGSAVRVASARDTSESDMDFDADGVLSGVPPYGQYTSVVTLYDQWGSDDCTIAEGYIQLSYEPDTYRALLISNSGSTALTNTYNNDGAPSPAFQLSEAAWAASIIRYAGDYGPVFQHGLATTTSVAITTTTGSMQAIVNSGTPQDIPGTHFTTDSASQDGVLQSLVGIVNGSPAKFYSNAGTAVGVTYTPPIGYTTGQGLEMFKWPYGVFQGVTAELMAFSIDSDPTSEVPDLDTILKDIEAPMSVPDTASTRYVTHVLDTTNGGNPVTRTFTLDISGITGTKTLLIGYNGQSDGTATMTDVGGVTPTELVRVQDGGDAAMFYHATVDCSGATLDVDITKASGAFYRGGVVIYDITDLDPLTTNSDTDITGHRLDLTSYAGGAVFTIAGGQAPNASDYYGIRGLATLDIDYGTLGSNFVLSAASGETANAGDAVGSAIYLGASGTPTRIAAVSVAISP